MLDEALAYYSAQLAAELLPSGKRTRTLLKQRTRVPTMLFRGPEDPMTVDKWFADSPALFPEGCVVVDIEGTGHFPHREDPEQFASVLLDFFGPCIGGAPMTDVADLQAPTGRRSEIVAAARACFQRWGLAKTTMGRHRQGGRDRPTEPLSLLPEQGGARVGRERCGVGSDQ